MTGTSIYGASVDDMNDALRKTIGEASDITTAAVDEGRELTDAENGRVEELLLRADGIKSRITRKSAPEKETRAAGKNWVPAADLNQVAIGDDRHSKARRGSSWGTAVVKQCSDGVHRFKGLTPTGSVLVDVPAPEPVAFGRPVTSLRSLIASAPTDGVYSLLRQTLRTNNAAPVAPGALKPTSPYNFERVQDRVRVLAHLSEPIPRQDLSDAPLLQAFIQSEMFYGLETALEDQILNGDGTGENLLGLAHTPGYLTVSPVPNATAPDPVLTMRRAITRLEASGIEGTGWVMSPTDWEAVETWSTTQGVMVLQGAAQTVPIDRAARRLWGIPVVSSVACPPGTAWLADFAGSTKLYVREEARLDWSENTFRPDAFGPGEGASDFSRNLLAFRAEGRFGFAVTRPSGVVRISLS